MSTETTVQNLKINKLTKAQFDTITPSATEAYELTDLSSILDTIPSVDQTYNASSSNAQSGVAIAGAGFLQNTATGASALTIGGTASSNSAAINIGNLSEATANNSVALGYRAEATANFATTIGRTSKASGACAIQIGYGTNSTANTLSIGFYNNSSTHYNWQLLDGTTGLIPTARIDTDTTATSGSAKPITSGAVYTIVGNIESALNTINSGS